MVLVCICAAFDQKKKVLLVSPEMNRVEMGERFVVKHGGFNYGDVVSATLGMYAEPQFFKTIEEIQASPEAANLFILDDEDKLEPTFIEEAIEATDADLVGIDSAYMLKVAQKGIKSGPGSRGDRQERMVQTVDWMRSTSRRTQKPVCAISQLARAGKVKKSAKETLKKGLGTGGLEDHLAFSDTLFQDCHNLFALFQDDDMKLDKQMLFVPLKARRQALWSAVVSRWDMDEMNFEEIGTSVISDDSDDDFDDKGHDYVY
jgi:replicative DNA helicase